jgi:outer membrane protein assembly factor BamB
MASIRRGGRSLLDARPRLPQVGFQRVFFLADLEREFGHIPNSDIVRRDLPRAGTAFNRRPNATDAVSDLTRNRSSVAMATPHLDSFGRRLARTLLASAIAASSGCWLFDSGTAPGGSSSSAGSTDHAVSRLWYVADSGAPGVPAFDGSVVYFLGKRHNVVAIDGNTGVKRWTSSTAGTGPATYGLSGCVMAATAVVCGDEDLIALRASDGVLLWRYRATTGYSPGYFALTAIGSLIVAGSPSGTVYGIDAAGGTARWVQQPFPADTEDISIFDPAADSDIVVAPFTKFLITKPSIGGVVALDAATGVVRWITYLPQSNPTIGTNAVSALLWNGVVITSSNTAGTIYALDRQTGAIVWNLPGVGTMPASRGSTPVAQDLRALTVVGNTLFAASLSDWLVAYDLPTRMESWRTESTEGSASLAPIAADNTGVYTTLAGGQLVAFSATTPSVRWITSGTLDSFYGTVAIGTDRVFASRTDGFYALPK